MHRSSPHRTGRGAVLVITVLICVIAATITLLLLRQSLVGVAATNRDVSYTNADSQISTLRTTTESSLLSAPYGFLAAVGPNEPPRTCATTTPTTTVPAGGAWNCGTVWTYTDIPTTGVWTEVVAPTSTDPALRISYHVANPATVETIAYYPNQAGVFSAQATAAPLDLATFRSPSLAGGFYAASDITAPASPVLTDTTTLASSGNIQGTPAGANIYLTSTTPALSALTSPTGPTVLATTLDALHDVSCPGRDPVAVNTVPDHLCLAPSAKVLLRNGTLATLPANTVAVLLVKDPSGVNLQVRYQTAAPNITINDNSSVPNVHADTANRVAQHTFGGVTASWTVLGDITVPASGLIGTSVNTWIGMCDAAHPNTGFMDPGNGTCLETALPEGTTVVAGTNAEPKSVWLSGPVTGERLAALASGTIVLPWFASTTPTAAKTTINHVSLATVAGMTSYPTTAISTLTATSYTGLMVAPGITFNWSPFTSTSHFTPATAMAGKPPTWFPGTTLSWAPVTRTLN